MIDIHSHLLYSVDDGATSLEESIEIIKEALKSGVDKIVATPHYLEPSYVVDKEENIKRINDIKKGLKEQNINNFEVYLGNEVYVATELIEKIKNKKITLLNNSKYLLIEFPFQRLPMFIENVLFELKSIGVVPIIAHPERYNYSKKDEDKLYELLNRGCLFQCNVASIDGVYGRTAKKRVKFLLKNDMVQLLATDNHKKGHIYSRLSIYLKKIEKIIGKEKLNELINENPMRVIENKDIII